MKDEFEMTKEGREYMDKAKQLELRAGASNHKGRSEVASQSAKEAVAYYFLALVVIPEAPWSKASREICCKSIKRLLQGKGMESTRKVYQELVS